jgi:hypothetical protein
MKTIRSQIVVIAVAMVMVAVAGPLALADAADKSGSKPSTPVMGQSMEKATAKPAVKFKAEPAAKKAVKKERKQKAQGDTRLKNGKNAGGRDKAA